MEMYRNPYLDENECLQFSNKKKEIKENQHMKIEKNSFDFENKNSILNSKNINIKGVNEDEETNNYNAITASNSAAQIQFKFKNQ